MSATGDLRPSHDWQKIVLFVLTIAGAVYAFGDKIFSVGRQTVTSDRVEHVEATINQMAVDQARTKLQAEMANAGVQQLRTEVHDGIHDLNEQLRHLNITSRNR